MVAACGRTELAACPAGGLLRPGPGTVLARAVSGGAAHLVESLRCAGLGGSWRAPAKSSLFRARDRLGPEPLRVLFAATARPLVDQEKPGAFWRGLRLVAVDGTCRDVADSRANGQEFGRPGGARNPDGAAFPQVRMVPASAAPARTPDGHRTETGPRTPHPRTAHRVGRTAASPVSPSGTPPTPCARSSPESAGNSSAATTPLPPPPEPEATPHTSSATHQTG
ncbi:transposase domain-containing protein [Streptomyces sp. NPDC000941]